MLRLFFHPGAVEFLSRTSQLSNANHLQKLQANSSSDRIDFDSEEETQRDGLSSCILHVHRLNLLHFSRLQSLAKVFKLRSADHFVRTCLRRCDWKRTGTCHEETQSAE